MGKAIAILEGGLILFNLHNLFNFLLENECNDIANQLSNIDFRSFLSDNIDKRVKGTGTWVLNSQKMTDWLSGKFQLLWCSGNRKFHYLITYIYLIN